MRRPHTGKLGISLSRSWPAISHAAAPLSSSRDQNSDLDLTLNSETLKAEKANKLKNLIAIKLDTKCLSGFWIPASGQRLSHPLQGSTLAEGVSPD